MKRVLDSERRAAIAERLRFYRDLGIYDFYRQAVPSDVHDSGLAERMAVTEIEAVAGDAAAEPLRALDGDSSPEQEAMKKKTVLLDKPAALVAIRNDLGDCQRCKLHRQGRKQIVFGVGNAEAELMFVGEGPGADEDAQGEPFVGRAGQLLNNMISAMGLRREDVYIGNVVKCRPPQNRTPERDECETCSPFLMRQIAVVRPKIIVALGAVAAHTLLGMTDSMAKLRGRIYDFAPALPKNAPEHDAEFSTKLAVTYHPAYLLRDPRQKKETWKDLQMVMRYLGLAVPGRSGEQN
jgi:DNA polymerase